MKRTGLATALLLVVSLSAAQPTNQLEIELKKTEPAPLQTSEYADVWLEVTNEGNSEADNVHVSFRENYPFSVDGDDRKKWSIGSIVPGEEYQLHLQTRVDSNAVQGNNTLNFELKQGDFSYIEKVDVEVRSDRNVLAVKSVEFPDNVAPGSSNQMQLKLTNLADSQLKNIQVGLDLSDDLPMATSESSRKHIVQIGPSESRKVNYTLNIDGSAENSVYRLPVDISFENEAGTEFEQSLTTGVRVGGEPQLKAAINTDKPLENGKTQEITFRLVNRGHGSADFVSMQLNETENIEVIGSNEVYIGSMDPDDFQTASFRLNVNAETESVKVKEIRMPVELSYRDAKGEQSVTQNVNAELYTQEELKQYGLKSNSSLIPIAVVVLLVAAGGIYYWRKRKGQE